MAVQLTVTTNMQTVNLTVQKYTPAPFPEAPEDGNIYGRKDAQWVEVSVDDELTPDELAGIQNANGLSSANPASTIEDISDKTDKGGYEGTAQDLKDEIDGVASGYRGTIAIADTPTEDGIYTPTEDGTYTNAGGLVYDPYGVDKGFDVKFIKTGSAWEKSVVELTSDGKVIAWIDSKTGGIGTQRSHLGKLWESNAAVIATDVPGTSAKWVEIIGFNSDEFVKNESLFEVGKNLYNPNSEDIVQGFYINHLNGTLIASETYLTSGKIGNIVGGEVYFFTNVRQLKWMDEFGGFISGLPTPITSATAPPNAKSLQISTLKTLTEVQVEKSTVRTSYEPYKKTIRDKFLVSIDSVVKIESDFNSIIQKKVDYSYSNKVLDFKNGNALGEQIFSGSVFSGSGMYVGLVPEFRYIEVFVKCADWDSLDKTVTKVKLMIKENDASGVVLHTVTNDVNIEPGNTKSVVFDLGEKKTFSQNLFIDIRANEFSTLIKAEDSTYPFIPANGLDFPNFSYATQKRLEPNVFTLYSGTNPDMSFFINFFDDIKLETELTDNQILNIQSRLGDEPILTDVDIYLPEKINAIVGDTIQIYFRSVIKHPNPYIFDILVTCDKGIYTPRYFEYTPNITDVGVTDFKIQVKNNKGVVIGEKTCSLVTSDVVKSPNDNVNILAIGDSLTFGGTWCKEASRRLIGTGGSPSANGLTNLSFKGRIKGDGIGWEGNGGWSWLDYTIPGDNAYKFFISGITTIPENNARYSHNGTEYYVTEVNVTDGTGYIRMLTRGTVTPPLSSGVLTKIAGSGDVNLNFSSVNEEPSNPFWNESTEKLDFTRYVDTYLDGQIDVAYIFLSWNRLVAWKSDFSDLLGYAKDFVDKLRLEYPNCKVKIMGIQQPSLNGGMGYNYGAKGFGYADQYGMQQTAWNMAKAYIDWSKEPAYSTFLEFIDVCSQFDSENNMPEIDKNVNVRSTKTEKVGNNGVHPKQEGYESIGDIVYRNIIYNFCQ